MVVDILRHCFGDQISNGISRANHFSNGGRGNFDIRYGDKPRCIRDRFPAGMKPVARPVHDNQRCQVEDLCGVLPCIELAKVVCADNKK